MLRSKYNFVIWTNQIVRTPANSMKCIMGIEWNILIQSNEDNISTLTRFGNKNAFEQISSKLLLVVVKFCMRRGVQ